MSRRPLYTKEHVLQALHEWVLRRGVSPTIAELRETLGGGSPRTILRYLGELEADGAIERVGGARGIRLRRRPNDTHRTRSVPLVGEVVAGAPSLAEEHVDAWVRLPEHLLSSNTKYFLLRVRGHSMNEAEVPGGKIEDGDVVLVKQGAVANPGDVVVAVIDGEATVKRLARGVNYFVLQPVSSYTYEPIVLDRESLIQGTVIWVFKGGVGLMG